MNSRYPQRILFYRTGQIGDTVMALPAIWAIRRYFPGAFLALLNEQHAGNAYIKASRVLPEQGLFDEFISYEANRDGAPFFKLLRLIPQLRQGQFDTLVYLAPRFRTKRQIWRDLLFFRLSGIRRIIGHRGMISYGKFAAKKPLPYIDNEADHFLSRLSRSGIPVPQPGQGCMDLLLTDTEIQSSSNWLAVHAKRNQHQIVIGMGIGGKFPAQRWPKERFVQLGHYIVGQLGGVPVIFGGPEDREMGQDLVREWGAGANAAGELTVRQAAAALSFCRLYVGNDTGTMHLAAAVGTQCIGIFSARNLPGEWYPYGPNHVVLKANIACEGCKLTDCVKNDMACLKMINVNDVKEGLDKALKN
jgi:heptosyltransferase III